MMKSHKGKVLKLLVSVFVISGVIAGCSSQPERIKDTKSGMAEARFVNTDVNAVRGKLIEQCSSRGRQVRDVSDNLVVCSKQVEGAEAAAIQLLIGNAYSTPPESVAQFTFYQSDKDVKVLGSMWVETQMPSGQTKKVPLNGAGYVNTIQQALYDMGAV